MKICPLEREHGSPKVTEEPVSVPGIKSGLLILILVFLGLTWTGGYLEWERLPQAPGGIF